MSWRPAGSGSPVAPSRSIASLPVEDGVFTVYLDFSGPAIDNSELWLEVEVRQAGGPEYAILSPRQAITSAPRSLLANFAGDNAVDTTGIVDNTVMAADIAPASIDQSRIQDGSVSAVHISPGAATTGKIQSGAVQASGIAPGAVNSTAIQTNAVGAGELATGSIGAKQIVSNAVVDSHVQPDSVSADKIYMNVVTTGHIADGAVDADAVQSGAVNGAEVDSSEIQRRITGSCPAGQSIRTIQSTGGVTCESDLEGIVGFNSPVTYDASSVNGGGEVTATMSPANTHICLIALVDLRDVDSQAEQALCQLEAVSGNWTVTAYATPGRDASAYCRGLCFRMVSAP